VSNKANWPRAPGNGRGPAGPGGPLRDRLRQTKPISRWARRVGYAKQSQSRQGSRESSALWAKRYGLLDMHAKQSQLGDGRRHAGGKSCQTKMRPTKVCFNRTDPRYRPGNAGRNQTRRLLSWASNKPNFGEPAGRTGGAVVQTKPTPPFQHSTPRPIVRNKPNSRRRHVGRGLGDEGELCKTNPIWGSPAGVRSPIVQNKANFGESGWGPRAKRAKQSQTWEGWRMWASAVGQPRRKVERAKQTQFSAVPRGTGFRRQGMLYKRTQLVPLCRSGDRCFREGQSCETKPICGDATRDGAQGTRGERTKQTQFPRWGGTRVLYKQTQLLPLCRSGDRRFRGANRAKQTQLAPARAGSGPLAAKNVKQTQSWAGCPCHGAVGRAKQSQFGAGPPDGGRIGGRQRLETANLGPETPAGACDRQESR
jgi:hypothetical protein